MKTGNTKKLIALLIILMLSTMMPAFANNEDLESLAFQMKLFDTKSSIEALVDKAKVNDSNIKGSFREDENAFLFTSNQKTSGLTYLVTGKFDQSNFLELLSMSWVGMPEADSQTIFYVLSSMNTLQYGDPFREIGETTYRNEPGGDIDHAVRLSSWQSVQGNRQIFIHIKSLKTIDNNRTISLILTANDLVLPDEPSGQETGQAGKSAKSKTFKEVYSSMSLYLYDTEFASLGSVFFFIEATAIDNQWFKDFSNNEEAFIVKHDLGYSMYWFSDSTGFVEIHYNAESDIVSIFEHGAYLNATLTVMEKVVKNEITDYKKADMDSFWTNLNKVLNK